MAGGTKRQKDMRKALRQAFPRVPMHDAEAILAVALSGHLRHLPASIAVWQAGTTHIRHELTDYDALLDDGYDRDAARFFVIDDMNEILSEWGSQIRLDPHDP
ncbi:DUF2293 domain-containing protein [Roseibium denhamense]|uniref:DUF2293 domain-containing protein n=1 Tax=Roseibium denhamense TaxID=76305 RepID=A0ABY1PPX2_9HYPH|nr:DUF2293 domain-containing protein [Roseibium denhamense]MTI04224.1 DUF2293 domain-containing protein [Roseibium denhamense]SMP36866.1 hypothetical protein SAMN06265374_4349 [Roseibium denhamense]